eukprot:11208875-Alexandrium_andersonii.AAC.1
MAIVEDSQADATPMAIVEDSQAPAGPSCTFAQESQAATADDLLASDCEFPSGQEVGTIVYEADGCWI